MPNCSVLNCRNDSRIKNITHGGISYHRFPQNPHLKEKWIDATGRLNWVPLKYSTLCSLHFEDHYFYKKRTNNRYLCENAVPTLNIVRHYVRDQEQAKREIVAEETVENPDAITDSDSDSDNVPSTSKKPNTTIINTKSNIEYEAKLEKASKDDLRKIIKGKDERIRHLTRKVRKVYSRMTRLRKKLAIAEGELNQRRVEDDHMGIIRSKYLHQEPKSITNPSETQETVFINVQEINQEEEQM